MRCCHEGVHREQAQRRGTVDHDVRELLTNWLDPVLQPKVRVELPHQFTLELRERDPRRRDPQVRLRRRHDRIR